MAGINIGITDLKAELVKNPEGIYEVVVSFKMGGSPATIKLVEGDLDKHDQPYTPYTLQQACDRFNSYIAGETKKD